MDDIEQKLAMFRLDDQSVKSVLRTLDLVRDSNKGQTTYTVETIIVRDGEAEVISKEDLNV